MTFIYLFLFNKCNESCPLHLNGLPSSIIKRGHKVEEVGFSQIGGWLLFEVCPSNSRSTEKNRNILQCFVILSLSLSLISISSLCKILFNTLFWIPCKNWSQSNVVVNLMIECKGEFAIPQNYHIWCREGSFVKERYPISRYWHRAQLWLTSHNMSPLTIIYFTFTSIR